RRIVMSGPARDLNETSSRASWAKAASCGRCRALGIRAFGIGSHVRRFSERVTKVHLQSMAHRVAQDELAGVIVADPDGGPRHQGRELGIPERNRGQPETNRRAAAVRQLRSEQAQTERCSDLPSRAIGPPETRGAVGALSRAGGDILRGAESVGSGGGEEVLKVGNWRNHGVAVFA